MEFSKVFNWTVHELVVSRLHFLLLLLLLSIPLGPSPRYSFRDCLLQLEDPDTEIEALVL